MQRRDVGRRWFASTMMKKLLSLLLVVTTVYALPVPIQAQTRAGAFAQDISPTKFPISVNGGMKDAQAQSVHDPMHARCLALANAQHEILFCVVDACMIPLEICEKAKEIASRETGVPKNQILISATHTHSAATLAPVFQSEANAEYVATVPDRIARGLIKAHENLEPAEVGWGFGSDPTQVFNRRWFIKDGQTVENPFGAVTDRAQMNPGNVSKKVSVPSGPVDQDVAVLAARSAKDQRPIALLANYSLHYVGGNPAISADYYGVFCNEIAARFKTTEDSRYHAKPAFVGILSNGTSGNINNINYGSSLRFKRNPGEQIVLVAKSVADAAMAAFDSIQWQKDLPLGSAETDLQLGVRKANAEELATAKSLLETTPKDKDGQWADRKAIYAREAVKLADYPDTVPVKLQAHRVGDLSLAAIPCEVFVEIGLELKKTTPFTRHFTVSLANGYNGYLPTEEHHQLGGYETWRARSSYLEVNAASKITGALQQMLKGLHSQTQSSQ